MCRFSFINVVCEILKLNCDLYKYMLYLSHGKAKEKRKKGRGLPRVPAHLALGEEQIKKKGHGPKIKKKRQSLPRVPWHLALREGKIKKKTEPSPSALATGTRGRFSKKKTNFFPECCTRGRGSKKKKFLPRVLHSGKSKKKYRRRR
jgi:hypothetical protein